MSVVTKCNSSGLKNEISLFKHLKYEHFLAGISGGVTSTLALHPLDVIKIRFAVNDGRSGCTPHYKGIANAFSTIYREEGLRGLYRGVVPNVWGAGVSWGFYFLFYNSIKTWIQKGNVNEPLGAPYHLLAATEAGIITLFIANPLWVVKTRLCIQHNGREDYKGLFDALVKIYRKDGPRGYYKGIVPGMFGVSHGAVQFMVYEEMKNRYNKFHNLPITTKLSTAHYLCFAATSKIAAVLTTYPYQVVRARLQNQYYTYNGSIDCIKQTWQYEGWRGFYKGMTANILRVTPAAVITFLSYENISHFLINEQGSKK